MVIFLAVPFLLAAGLFFTLLSLIPPGRRFAIPIPTGILATAPCLVAVLMLEVLVEHFWPMLERTASFRGGWLLITLAATVAISGGVLTGIVARFVAAILPGILLWLSVFVAAWCSYFVVAAALGFFLQGEVLHWRSHDHWHLGLLIVAVEGLLGLTGAWFMARKSEQFRPKTILLPFGLPFRWRNQAEG